MILQVLLIGSIVALVFIYLLGKNNERYWKKRGVKFYSKNRLLGVFWEFLTTKGAMFEKFNNLYNQFKGEPAVGIGGLFSPSIFITHPKNVQHVLQTDFSSFYHRGLDVNEEDHLADNILFMNGPRWKLMRKNMTPLFTSTKLKNMYYIIDKSAQDLVEYLKENPKTWTGEQFETFMTYGNASVCGGIFGIGSESVFDSPFLKMATKITTPTLINNLKFFIMSLNPTIGKALGITFFKEFENFFVGAMKNVIEQREKENVKRHDFADICISIRKNGIMKDDSTDTELIPTYELLTAQAMFFLIAGVEPVAVGIFATLVELSEHSDILSRVHEEVDQTFSEFGDKLTYDAITKMTYTDQVLSEAIRKNPPIGYLTRQCVKDTILPVGNVPIQKGTKIFTPIYSIHHDPDYYDEPDVFNPERFAPGNKPNDEIYMPFGMGNRTCIGERYSKLQMLAGIVHILRHFTVQVKKLGGPIAFKPHFNMVRRIDVDIILIPRKV